MSNYITYLDYYLPNQRLSVTKDLDFFKNPNHGLPYGGEEDFLQFNEKTLGLDTVLIEEEKTMEEMAIELLDKCLDEGTIIPENIDYIMLALDFDDHLIDFGHYVQHQFDMEKAKVIRVAGSHCTNIDLAIHLACKILNGSKGEQNILLITGSKLSNKLNERIVGTYGIMGDSIGLAQISNIKENALLEVIDQEIIVKGELVELGFTADNAILHFQSYTECLDNLLEEDTPVDTIILHNSNQLLMEQVLLTKGLDIEKIDKTNQSKYGHLGTTDLILNLKTYIENSNGSKDNILSLNLGISGTYVGSLFQKN